MTNYNVAPNCTFVLKVLIDNGTIAEIKEDSGVSTWERWTYNQTGYIYFHDRSTGNLYGKLTF